MRKHAFPAPVAAGCSGDDPVIWIAGGCGAELASSSRMRRLIVVIAFLMACDGDSSPSDAFAFVPPDAPTPKVLPVRFFDHADGTEIFSFKLPDVQVGQQVWERVKFLPLPGGGHTFASASSDDPELLACDFVDGLNLWFTPTTPGPRAMMVRVWVPLARDPTLFYAVGTLPVQGNAL